MTIILLRDRFVLGKQVISTESRSRERVNLFVVLFSGAFSKSDHWRTLHWRAFSEPEKWTVRFRNTCENVSYLTIEARSIEDLPNRTMEDRSNDDRPNRTIAERSIGDLFPNRTIAERSMGDLFPKRTIAERSIGERFPKRTMDALCIGDRFPNLTIDERCMGERPNRTMDERCIGLRFCWSLTLKVRNIEVICGWSTHNSSSTTLCSHDFSPLKTQSYIKPR